MKVGIITPWEESLYVGTFIEDSRKLALVREKSTSFDIYHLSNNLGHLHTGWNTEKRSITILRKRRECND